MNIFKEPITYVVAITIGLLVWFYTVLFYYNHSYKVETKSHITNVLFTDNQFDKGDKVIVTNSEGEYRLASKYSEKVDTVLITKVLR